MTRSETTRSPRLAASILSADFTQLGAQVAEAETAGSDWIHVDVMDGHFVPNISIGLPVLKALRGITRRPLDVHLMIEQPERYIDAFAEAGADHIIIHVEACRHLYQTIQRIRDVGAQPGVTLNPGTPLWSIEDVLPEAHQVLVMSVDPGFGGQAFIPRSLEKIATLRQRLDEASLPALISVDGGVKADNARAIVEAGADVLVVGSGIFSSHHGITEGVARLREAMAGTARLA